jgi:acetolactate synthase-1/2/3 large subunit
LEIAEKLGAPIVTTISGQGIIPDDHPLALGVIGDNGFHPHALRTVDEADILLYVGCKLGSVSTLNWTLPSPRPGRVMLQIDIDPIMLCNNFPKTIGLSGDAKLVLQELMELLGSLRSRKSSPWVDDLNKDRKDFWTNACAELESSSMPLKPQRVIHSLNKHLPSPAIVISDAGTPTPYITRFLRLGGNGSRFLLPRAYGGLGYAIPAVVGAHMARPDARPVGLFGDGSFGMSAGELETLVRLNIPAVLIHFNNGCFGWIKALQAIHCENRYLSVDFTPSDVSQVAKAFGLLSFRVETPQALEAALEEAFAASGPAFLDIVCESVASELPPVYSWLTAAGRISKVA